MTAQQTIIPTDLDDELPSVEESTSQGFAPLDASTYLARLDHFGEKHLSQFPAKAKDGTEFYPHQRKVYWDIIGQDRQESEFMRVDTMNEKSKGYEIYRAIFGKTPDPQERPKLSTWIGRYALLDLQQQKDKNGNVSGFMKIAGHMTPPLQMLQMLQSQEGTIQTTEKQDVPF